MTDQSPPLASHSVHRLAFRCVATLVLLVAAWIAAPAGAQSGCATSACHQDLTAGRFIHEPAADDCSNCHLRGSGDHPASRGAEFSLEEQVPALCGECHDLQADDGDLHPPVAEGECTTCHDPHRSKMPFLLVGDTPGAACAECHDAGDPTDDFVHGPVAVGACMACHSAHGSVEASLLADLDRTTMCYQCHEDVQDRIAAHQNIHGPVAIDCTSCHNPHQSNHKFQLEDGAPGLCLSCHEEIADILATASVTHGAITQGRSCLGCHTPHGSDYAFNLQDETFDLCLGCHDHEMGSPPNVLTNMSNLLATKPDWHGPIRERDCSGCHDPHGASNMRLLRLYYPPSFYSPFDLDNYQLCFQCHEERNVQEEFSSLTNFRDGQRNLHFLHVNRQKGRTCRACHQVHASTHPNHIRDSVPFGSWELPINFEPTAEGGGCTPGCHKTKTYTR